MDPTETPCVSPPRLPADWPAVHSSQRAQCIAAIPIDIPHLCVFHQPHHLFPPIYVYSIGHTSFSLLLIKTMAMSHPTGLSSPPHVIISPILLFSHRPHQWVNGLIFLTYVFTLAKPPSIINPFPPLFLFFSLSDTAQIAGEWASCAG